ncbi:MAG: hypothetical protein R6T83_11835 [Salinibacter sp.]
MSASFLPSPFRAAWARARAEGVKARKRIERQDAMALVAPLTLILLLLYPGTLTETRAGLQLGAVAGLLYRPLQRVPAYWWALTALMALYCVLTWHDADNHKYLITYWCLAVGLSCWADDTAQALRMNGRLLVGLCFLVAVGWKLRTPDFLTGEYYQHAMLTDDRITRVAQLLAGMDASTFNANRDAVSMLTAYSSTLERVALDGPDVLRALSKGMVAWTLAIESAIIGSFLWPGRSPWAALGRDLSLLIFAATTYALANVGGFAWILLTMGLAQVRRERASWRLGYLSVLALVILYQIGPLDYLVAWFG